MTDTEFIQAMNENKAALMRFAMKLVGDIDDAEELFQATIFRAYTKKHTYTRDISARAWFMTIMRNIFLNGQAHEERYRAYAERLSHVAHDVNAAASISARLDIMRAIRTLPAIYCLPLYLLISGLHYHEIAEILGLPMSTVRNRIHIARKQLRILLDYYDN